MNDLLPMGALVKRELIRSLRRPRSLGLVAFVVLAAAVAVVVSYPAGDALPFEVRGAAQTVFGSVIAVLFASAVLLLPTVAASSLVLEREQDTYELLWLTMLGPWGIAMAKTLNAVGYYLLIACAVLPVMSVSAFLVGVDMPLLIFGFLTVVATALACASVGILCSASARTTAGAVFVAYGVIFFILVGYMAPVSIARVVLARALPASVNWLSDAVTGLLLRTSPVYSLATIIGDPASASDNFAMPITALVAQCAVALAATAYAARILSRPTEKQIYLNPVGVGQISSHARPVRMVGSLPPLSDNPRVVPVEILYERPLPLWPPVRDGVNPMFAREMIQAKLNRRLTGPRATILCLVGAAILGGSLIVVAGSSFLGEAIGIWMGVGLLFAALIAPLSASACWARENETETLDMLRMTAMTPWQIVTGKFAASLRAAQQFYVLFFAFSFPALFALLGGIAPVALFVAGLVSLAATVIECVAFCVFAGLNEKRTPAAIVSGVVCLALLLAVPAVIVPMFLEFGDGELWIGLASAFLSPAAGYDVLILFGELYPVLSLAAWLASCAVHAAIGYGLLRWAARRYETHYARAG